MWTPFLSFFGQAGQSFGLMLQCTESVLNITCNFQYEFSRMCHTIVMSSVLQRGLVMKCGFSVVLCIRALYTFKYRYVPYFNMSSSLITISILCVTVAFNFFSPTVMRSTLHATFLLHFVRSTSSENDVTCNYYN